MAGTMRTGMNLPSLRLRRSRRLHYAWTIVFAAFVIAAAGYGVQLSFGVFLKPLAEEFEWTRTAISGAFAAFMLMKAVLATAFGKYTDRYGPRVFSIVGALFLGTGMILASTIKDIWLLYVVYALFISVGIAAIIVPLSATISRWFYERRGLALGILNGGAGVGMLVMSPVAGLLIERYSIGMAYIVGGAVVLAVAAPCALLIRREPGSMGLEPYGVGKARGTVAVDRNASLAGAVNWTLREAVRTRAYWFMTLIYTVWAFCLLTVNTNIVAHATDMGHSSLVAPTLLSFIGGLFLVGVLAFGLAGDRFGHKVPLAICVVCHGILVLWLANVHSFAHLVAFSVLFGIFYGGMVVAITGLTAELFGLRAMGAIFGLLFGIGTLGGAAGSLIGNIIYDMTDPHSYTPAFWLAGSLLLVTSPLFPFLKTPRKA